MEYNVSKKEIINDRELGDLDKLVLEFVGILEKHVEYVIISGYVSILLGRSRATEDVDLFVKKISKQEFLKLNEDLDKHGFWCINAENPETIFDYINDGLAIRYAKRNTSTPNFEVKFPKDTLDEESFKESIIVHLSKKKLRISSLERHVAFKRYYLGSDKDIEDSMHIEEIFKGKINYDKVNKLVALIKIRKKSLEEKNKFNPKY